MNGFMVQRGGMLCSIQDAGRKRLNDIGLSQSWSLIELALVI